MQFQSTLPGEAGISPRAILNFIDRLEEKGVPMHSFQLLFRDQVLAEGYYAPYSKNTLHRMFSISKSVVTLAIGLLLREGRLSPEDPIIRYFPDKLPEKVHPWIAGMTIRNMLMMRTCHSKTTYKLNPDQDWVESFFTTPPSHPAGQLFHYDTSSAHVLCALAERLSGKKLWDYVRDTLSPLEFSPESYFLEDPFGVSMGGSGLVCTPEDLRKLAYFIEHEGVIDGKSFLPDGFIKEATSNLTPTAVTAPLPSEACGYGYQFWRNQRGGYTCYGMGGQLMIFLPDYELICITTADTQGISGGNQLIYDALYEEILPAFSEKGRISDPAAQEALDKKLHSLAISPLTAQSCPVVSCSDNSCGHFSGRHIWELEENPQGFTRLELTLPPQAESFPTEGQLTLYRKDTIYPLRFGFGHLVCDTFPVYDQRYAASAIWLEASTLYIKFHIIDAYVGNVHIQIHFEGSQITVFLRKVEESLFREFSGHLVGFETDLI